MRVRSLFVLLDGSRSVPARKVARPQYNRGCFPRLASTNCHHARPVQSASGRAHGARDPIAPLLEEMVQLTGRCVSPSLRDGVRAKTCLDIVSHTASRPRKRNATQTAQHRPTLHTCAPHVHHKHVCTSHSLIHSFTHSGAPVLHAQHANTTVHLDAASVSAAVVWFSAFGLLRVQHSANSQRHNLRDKRVIPHHLLQPRLLHLQ